MTLFAPPLMRTHHIEERAAGLEHMALLLEGQVLPYVTGAGSGDLEALVRDIGRRTATRITVIDAAGNVLADSEKEPGTWRTTSSGRRSRPPSGARS